MIGWLDSDSESSERSMRGKSFSNRGLFEGAGGIYSGGSVHSYSEVIDGEEDLEETE